MAANLTPRLEKAADHVSRARDMIRPGSKEGLEALAKAMEFLGRALIADGAEEKAESANAAENWAHVALRRAGFSVEMARGYSAVPGAEIEDYA